MTNKQTKPTTNRAAVEALLEALRRAGPIDAHDEALGTVALTLADALDDGAGMATAAVARELRAALATLIEGRTSDDDDTPAIFGSDLPA